jgi:peptidylprolyl isomerase
LRKSLATISALALLLTGCASPNQAELTGYALLSDGLTASCDAAGSGTAVDQVKAQGEFGVEPEVTFPTPLEVQGIQSKEIIVGTGGKVIGNQKVALHFSVYNAASGEKLQASEFGTENVVTQDLIANSNPDYCSALVGMSVGSRVAVLMGPDAAHNNQGIPSLGIGEKDALVFVFDVIDAYLPRANGESKPAEAGFPTVVLNPTTGQPGIQILKTEAPAEFKRSITIEGRGDEIQIGDVVVMHYAGWTWDGTQFDESWSSGSPASFEISSTGLIEGFVKAVEGAKIGSQIVAVIPPELGYGEAGSGSIGPNETLIFVIDILGKE